jgi:CLIP-associating protein 1/2
MGSGLDESLLLAQSVPIPLDDDSEDGANLMSFSAPFHSLLQTKDPLTPPDSQSLKSADSKPAFSVSNALSSGSIATVNSQPIVEDALKARAEQAESAAERLLELVEPEAESAPHPTLPSSLLIGKQSQAAPNDHPPLTPENRASIILKQAAMFEDSPAHSGKASLVDVLQENKQEGWWAKRRSGMCIYLSLLSVD